MKREIKLLKEELASGLHTVDSVKGSTREFPYTETTIAIEGPDVMRKKRIKARITKLTTECERTERFVESIDDSFTRQLIELHFLNGYGWGKVMRKTDCRMTMDGVRKRVDRFFKKF